MIQSTYLRFTTLEDLLKHYESPLELAIHLDYAMLIQVTSLNHEPELLRSMIPAYESMWMLKNLILNQIKPTPHE